MKWFVTFGCGCIDLLSQTVETNLPFIEHGHGLEQMLVGTSSTILFPHQPRTRKTSTMPSAHAPIGYPETATGKKDSPPAFLMHQPTNCGRFAIAEMHPDLTNLALLQAKDYGATDLDPVSWFFRISRAHPYPKDAKLTLGGGYCPFCASACGFYSLPTTHRVHLQCGQLLSTGDAEEPRNWITSTSGSETDAHALPNIQASLAQKNLLPALHKVDAGYVDAELLVSSQHHYEVDLVGLPREDHRWQARKHPEFALADFQIDWQKNQERCPQGRIRRSWTVAQAREQDVIKIKFDYTTCGPCSLRTHCIVAERRTLSVRPQAKFLALQAARARTMTEDFQRLYHQ